MRDIIYLWFPLVGYMVVIFIVSSGPTPPVLPDVWNIDKLYHTVEYGILAILWFRALRGFKALCREKTSLIIAIALTILFGITDEVHQLFVPGRLASISDVIADSIGACLGLWFYRRILDAFRKYYNEGFQERY